MCSSPLTIMSCPLSLPRLWLLKISSQLMRDYSAGRESFSNRVFLFSVSKESKEEELSALLIMYNTAPFETPADAITQRWMKRQNNDIKEEGEKKRCSEIVEYPTVENGRISPTTIWHEPNKVRKKNGKKKKVNYENEGYGIVMEVTRQMTIATRQEEQEWMALSKVSETSPTTTNWSPPF